MFNGSWQCDGVVVVFFIRFLAARLCSFKTVEEFWGYWNQIPKPRYRVNGRHEILNDGVIRVLHCCSEILFDGVSRKKFVNRTVTSFSVFKNDIRPEWEDPANSSGAEWFLRKRTCVR